MSPCLDIRYTWSRDGYELHINVLKLQNQLACNEAFIQRLNYAACNTYFCQQLNNAKMFNNTSTIAFFRNQWVENKIDE